MHLANTCHADSGNVYINLWNGGKFDLSDSCWNRQADLSLTFGMSGYSLILKQLKKDTEYEKTIVLLSYINM